MDERNTTCSVCGSNKRKVNFYTVNKASKKDFSKEEHITGDKFNICKICLKKEYEVYDFEQADKFFKEIDYAYSDHMWQYYVRTKIENGFDADFKNVFGTILSTLTMEKPLYSESEDYDLKYRRKIKEQRTDASNSVQNDALKKGYENLKRREKKIVEKAIKAKRQELEREMFLQEKRKFDVTPETLTEEDVIYLKGRWGDDYEIKQLISLERTFVDLIRNGDPNNPVQSNFVKKISKVSLLMDNALDEGLSSDWKDLGMLYDKLMKSAKLDKKKEDSELVSSISELTAICESTGFIELDNNIEFDKDKVDLTIDTMQEYTKDLVISETGLTKIIKNTLEEMVYNGMVEASDLLKIMNVEDEPEFVEHLLDIIEKEGD